MVLADGLGTTRATVDSTQAVTSTLTTEAFGNTVAQWGSSANPYRFAGDWGYRDDGDMGLLYIGARWYDPAVGRWTSADKRLGNIYHPLSLNRYLYREDDPVNAVDPSGKRTIKIGPSGKIKFPGFEVDIEINPPIEIPLPPVPPWVRGIGTVGACVAAAAIGWEIGEYISEHIPDPWYQRAGEWLYNLWPAPWHMGL